MEVSKFIFNANNFQGEKNVSEWLKGKAVAYYKELSTGSLTSEQMKERVEALKLNLSEDQKVPNMLMRWKHLFSFEEDKYLIFLGKESTSPSGMYSITNSKTLKENSFVLLRVNGQ